MATADTVRVERSLARLVMEPGDTGEWQTKPEYRRLLVRAEEESEIKIETA